nr:hypothetical protein [Tanacetum cinerariifolium]
MCRAVMAQRVILYPLKLGWVFLLSFLDSRMCMAAVLLLKELFIYRVLLHDLSYLRCSVIPGCLSEVFLMLWRELTARMQRTLEGRLDIGKQKLQTSDVADVFQAYSDLCSSNVQRRCSANLPQCSRALNFSSEEITDSDVFQRYTDLCATRPTATLSPTIGSISNKDNQEMKSKYEA